MGMVQVPPLSYTPFGVNSLFIYLFKMKNWNLKDNFQRSNTLSNCKKQSVSFILEEGK
jgi:hypothetical protein